MRNIILKTGAASAFALILSLAAASAVPSDLYVPVEYAGAPEDVGAWGLTIDDDTMAEAPGPHIPLGPDVEVQELQDAYPSTNWPPSMRK
ncbi:MAG: hypothetical protein R3D01_02495 [Hyphomicrobiales bacterium]